MLLPLGGSLPHNRRTFLVASGMGVCAGTAAIAFRCGGEELHVANLADAVDAATEKDRVEKQLGALRKSELALIARLANPGYADKAPAKLVEESRSQLAKIQAEIEVLERSAR